MPITAGTSLSQLNCKSTEGAKSQWAYLGLNSSVTECPIEIILSGMTYYHHWFEEFVKSKHIFVYFFQMKVHFRIYLIVWIVGSSQILLDCVWPFELLCTEKISDDRGMKLNKVIHYVWSGDWLTWSRNWVTPLTISLNIMGIAEAAQLRCRVTVSHNHPINQANKIN